MNERQTPQPPRGWLSSQPAPCDCCSRRRSGGAVAAFYDERRRWRLDWLRPASRGCLGARDPFAMGSFPLVPGATASETAVRIRRAATSRSRHAPGSAVGQAPAARHRMVAALAGGASPPARAGSPCPSRPTLNGPGASRLRNGSSSIRRGFAAPAVDQSRHGADARRHRPSPVFPAPYGTRLEARPRPCGVPMREVMPVALEPTVEVAQLREGVLLSELDLDNNFRGWQHEARIEWPVHLARW